MRMPAILDNVELTEGDTARLESRMVNWLRVHAHMIRQPRSWSGYNELLRMLRFELTHARRMQVALRIFRRAMVLYKELHEREIVDLPLR